jgi:hypothetical protein
MSLNVMQSNRSENYRCISRPRLPRAGADPADLWGLFSSMPGSRSAKAAPSS